MRTLKQLLIFICFIFLNSCQSVINWEETYHPNGKEPFGTYLFYNALKEYFPNTTIHNLQSNTDYASLNYDNSLIIAIGKQSFFSEYEFQTLMDAVYHGNTLFISSNIFDENFIYNFNIEIRSNISQQNSFEVTAQKSPKSYEVDFAKYLVFKTNEDNAKCIKGNNGEYPNLLGFSYGEGKIFIHSEPIAFTNINMLKNAKKYVEEMLGLVNYKSYNSIYFNSYVIHDNTISNFDVLFQYKAFKWAIYLTIILIIIYIIFNSKRRQKIIPVIAQPINNTSSFIETISRLYLKKSNNNTIANKKKIIVLDYIKTKLHLDITKLDNNFKLGLYQKVTLSNEEIEHFINTIIKLNKNIIISEMELITFEKISKKIMYER